MKKFRIDPTKEDLDGLTFFFFFFQIPVFKALHYTDEAVERTFQEGF